MWALPEVREKVCDFQKLPLDKSHFITEVQYNGKEKWKLRLPARRETGKGISTNKTWEWTPTNTITTGITFATIVRFIGSKK